MLAPPARRRYALVRQARGGSLPLGRGPSSHERKAVIMISQTFHTVITQPTTLCNMDCSYCYLPGRKRPNLMSAAVAEAVAASIVEQGDRDPVAVVWHCGEPLATPIVHMRRLLKAFDSMPVQHSVQTNATLIDDAWCDLLAQYQFGVGISIDGPAVRNAARVDWAGRETFSRTMRGIGKLRQAGIPYTAICVVTPETIGRAEELVRFFIDLGATSVGFNLEEREGANNTRQVIRHDLAEAFWLRLWQLHEDGVQLPIRDLDRVRDWLAARRAGNLAYGADPVGPLPTISFNGDVVMLSPELLGIQDQAHGNFVVGNVLNQPLPIIVRQAMSATYIQDFLNGLHACEASCEFWDFCRGAHAGNRYFENGSFASTETAHCRNTKQALARSALAHLSREEVYT